MCLWVGGHRGGRGMCIGLTLSVCAHVWVCTYMCRTVFEYELPEGVCVPGALWKVRALECVYICEWKHAQILVFAWSHVCTLSVPSSVGDCWQAVPAGVLVSQPHS